MPTVKDVVVLVKSLGPVPLTTLKAFTEKELLQVEGVTPAYVRKIASLLARFDLKLSEHNSGQLTHFVAKKRAKEREQRRIYYNEFTSNSEIMSRIMSDPTLRARFAPRDEKAEQALESESRLW